MSSNFKILHALWHTIQEAKLFAWPVGGVPLEELARPQDKNILEKFLSIAVPTFKEEDDHYFFPDPVDCERCVVNRILFANQHNLISLFMSLHFEEDPDSGLSTTDIYTLFLRWLREHRINVGLVVTRPTLIRRLQELGYERCDFGKSTGIYGIKLKAKI